MKTDRLPPPECTPAAPPMLTDQCMHSALTAFVQQHSSLPLSHGPICFVNEGTFTSLKRMRTLMPMTWHGKYPSATTLELRGEWHYPVMMMNDNQLMEPDPPVIIVRDAVGGVVVRLKPRTTDDVARMLEHDVFDLQNLQARLDESRHAAQRKEREVQKKVFTLQKRIALDVELKVAVASAVGKYDTEIAALARKIADHLSAQTFHVHTDVDEYTTVPALHAFEQGVEGGRAAVAKEVEERVCRALVQENS